MPRYPLPVPIPMPTPFTRQARLALAGAVAGLILLGMAVGIPLGRLTDDDGTAADSRMADGARLLVLALDTDLRGIVAMLEHWPAAAPAPAWSALYRIDAFGRPVAGPAPLAEPLPFAATVREAIVKAKPAVSPLTDGKVAVAVPRLRDGAVAEVAVATLPPDRWGRLIAAAALPEGWVAAVRDRTGAVLAGTAPAGTRDSRGDLPRDGGVLRLRGADGRRVTAAYQRSALAGWTITVGRRP